MPGNFRSSDGDLETMFVDDYAMIDQFAATGSLWMWGLNNQGQLGDNTIANKSSPVQTIAGGTNWKQVSWFSNNVAAIKTDGTLWMWGLNTTGAIGDNTTVSKSSPVQTIAGGTNWKQVAAGANFTAAIKTDGTLWVWGSNTTGQLADNTQVSKSSPVQTIAGGTNWKQVSCGSLYSAAAVKTDGTLWTWGFSSKGALGNNDTANVYSSPIQTVAGGTNWKQVSATGSDCMGAIKTDGTLWMWGNNQYGQLGDNTVVNKSSPVQTIAGGTNWKQVSLGFIWTAAIKTDGTLWMWGSNTSGQLGNNTRDSKSSPIQTISGGTNWKQVSGSGNGMTSTAIKTDGTLWGWGDNTGFPGSLGDNTLVSKSSPVQTIAGGTNWKQVSRGAAIYFYDAGNLYPSA